MSHPTRPVLCLDWDGTCVESAYPYEGDWMPGAVEALQYLAQYCHLIISSCRIAPVSAADWEFALPIEKVDSEVAYIRQMLDSIGLEEAEVWDLRTRDFKPPAMAYVDDKAVFYSGRSGAWKALIPKLLMMAGITDRSVLFGEEANG